MLLAAKLLVLRVSAPWSPLAGVQH